MIWQCRLQSGALSGTHPARAAGANAATQGWGASLQTGWERLDLQNVTLLSGRQELKAFKCCYKFDGTVSAAYCTYDHRLATVDSPVDNVSPT